MKISRLPILFVSLICILTSCNKSKDDTVTVIKHGKDVEYHIKTHQIKDSLDLKLSDYATDFEFIRLETTELGLISSGINCYIGDEYFLFEKHRGGIYQFARDGTFIRKIVAIGKGPTEYSRGDWSVDEKSQILYVTDNAKKNYFLRFDLRTGNYLGDIPKAIPSRTTKIEILDDNIIMANTYMTSDLNEIQAAVYWQDLSGKLIKSLPANPGEEMFFSYVSYAMHDDKFRIKMLSNDTVYTIQDDQLTPYLTFDLGKKNPPNRFHMGFTTIRIDKEVEPWIIMDVDIISEILKNDDGEIVSLSSKVQYYILDKKKTKAYHRGSIFIDPLHAKEKGHWIFYNKQGDFVKPYQAIYFLEHAEKALADPEFKEPYRSKLEEAIDGMTEEDNQVLLVGKYR